MSFIAPGVASAAQPSYTVTFDSTMVDNFLGVNNGPTGSFTNEYHAVVPLTLSATSGLYAGSTQASYVQTQGEADLATSCDNGQQATNNQQIDHSGNPTTFRATYVPATQTLSVTTGMPTENYIETTSNPLCVMPPEPITTQQPQWYSDWTKSHFAAIKGLSASQFFFTMTPGSGDDVGTIAFSGNPVSVGNLKVNENTTIVVAKVAQTVPTPTPTPMCTVPALRGDSLAAATRALTHPGCAVGAVTYKNSSKANKGRVLSSSPGAGAKEPLGTKVKLTVGRVVKRR